MNEIQVDYMKIIKDLINEDASSIRYKNIPASVRIEYIEKHDDAPLELVFSLDKSEFKGISDDEKKSKYLLQAYSRMHSGNILGDTDVISDDFYKMKVREQFGNEEYDDIVDSFMQESKVYKETLEKIQDMSEEEKYNYISKLDNKDIKTLFFYKTDDVSRRKDIVDSFEEDIDGRLKEPAKLAQKMIIDFLENNSNGQLTEKNKQELEMIFKRTKIEFDSNLDYFTNAQMRHTDYVMKINPNLLTEEPQKLILYFLHEYGHAISMKKFKTADYLISDILSVEEGMSDTFADLVAQSYSDRHGNIKLNGQDVDLKKATILKYSGYKDYNNLVRTMLYPAEQKGKDKEAVFSYYFDNKLKFYELTLGGEYVKKLPEDFNKNPCAFGFGYEEIYSYAKEDFQVLNEESIYLINNEPLKAFIEDERNGETINGNSKNANSIQITNKIRSSKIQSIYSGRRKDKDKLACASMLDMDMIDYYEKYGIKRDDDWKTIKQNLSIKSRDLMNRQSTTPYKDTLMEINEELDQIDEALALFKPGNEEKRKQYDAKLDEQKQRQLIEDNDKEEKSKISLEGIGASIRNNPTSLEHLRVIQQQMASQIKAREKSRDSMKFKSENQPEIDDIEK